MSTLMYTTRTPYRTIAILTDLEVYMEEKILQLNNWFVQFVEKNKKRFPKHEKLAIRTWFRLPIETRVSLRREIEYRTTACDKSGIYDLSEIIFELFTNAREQTKVDV